jgi:predicted ATPase/DNA-binding SARP family transcriptional activator/tetratricopeptide (TPR) repeat protein
VLFGVLGVLAAWNQGGGLIQVPEAKVRALLADLLIYPGRPVSADRLVEDLWGDRPPPNPAGALQSKVSRLRQALESAEPGGRELVVYQPPGYQLNVDRDAVDESRFTALIEQAATCEEPRTKAALLADALALWRGPALADFADAAFAQLAIARLEEQRLAAVEDFAEVRLTLGEHGLLTGELGDLVARHPLRERLCAAHMLALYRAGRQGAALDSFRELRQRLGDELGTDPGPAVSALHQAILEQSPSLRDVPPPVTLAARARTNLPALLTEVVGRTTALAELTALLPERRLVTLTGPGGVGKTRLALEAAARAAGAFPHGVWLAELDTPGMDGARGPADEVMAVLGVRDDPSGDPVARLAEALRDSRMLLILDNCERLVGPVAELASRLTRTAPGLHVLATSREPLALAGEVVWVVPPLALPDAVRLFVARAGLCAPGFRLEQYDTEAVEEICRRLDGLPLAVELAATRVRALGTHELLARLDERFRLLAGGSRDAPARQHTLRATIDWSWDLLTEPERVVLRRLAVAADGCGPRAAEAICAEDRLDVLDLVARLVDRSLIVVADGPDAPRYRLLESIAQYAMERLRAAGELDQTRLRHRLYYADLAERAAARLRGYDQRRWLRRLEVENPGLRVALDSSVRDGDPDTAMRIVNALTWSWFLSGRLTEAIGALDAALAVHEGLASTSTSTSAGAGAGARARAIAWREGFAVLAGGDPGAPPPLDEIDDPAERAMAGWFGGFVASDFGDPSGGEVLVSRALAEFAALGDRWGIAAALSTRAKQETIRGDLAAADSAARQSLAVFRELGDQWGQLQAIEWLAAAEAAAGNHEQATRLRRDGLRIAGELGLWPQAADALSWLGRSALRAGDRPLAKELLERALRLATEQSYRPGQVFAEIGLGATARGAGEFDVAETHLRNALRSSPPVRAEPDVGRIITLRELGFIAEQRGDPNAARAYHLECLAAAHDLGDLRVVAQALTGLAGAQALSGRPDHAAQLLGAADSAWRSVGNAPRPGDNADADRILAETRRALGEPAFAAEFDRGRDLGPDHARALVLA